MIGEKNYKASAKKYPSSVQIQKTLGKLRLGYREKEAHESLYSAGLNRILRC